MFGLFPLVAAQLQLKRITPVESFEHQISISPPLTAVLFCQSSTAACRWLEERLASVAAALAAERTHAGLQMVDTAEWGGESLRLRYGDPSTTEPEMIVFRRGLASVYHGSRDGDAMLQYLRREAAAITGRSPSPSSGPVAKEPPRVQEPSKPAGLLAEDGARVLDLTIVNFLEATISFPLLFILFYSAEGADHSIALQGNFSAAAYQLHEQRIPARLGKFEVREDWPEGRMFANRLGVQELPDIKVFRYGMPSEYQAGAGTVDLVDVARWNAGNLDLGMSAAADRSYPAALQRPTTAVHDVEGTAGFEKLLAAHRLVLLAFTTQWCTRCLSLATEFASASMLLASADPPVALAAVNIDNPRNRPLVDRFGVLSFPIGKIFHRGRHVGDFMGGSLAYEIVAEMLTIRDELKRAEDATGVEEDDGGAEDDEAATTSTRDGEADAADEPAAAVEAGLSGGASGSRKDEL